MAVFFRSLLSTQSLVPMDYSLPKALCWVYEIGAERGSGVCPIHSKRYSCAFWLLGCVENRLQISLEDFQFLRDINVTTLDDDVPGLAVTIG
jgi:hypothetical protein